MIKEKVKRSKMSLMSYAQVNNSANDEFVITLHGWNSKEKEVSVELRICDWQINNMNEQVVKIMKARIKSKIFQ